MQSPLLAPLEAHTRSKRWTLVRLEPVRAFAPTLSVRITTMFPAFPGKRARMVVGVGSEVGRDPGGT